MNTSLVKESQKWLTLVVLIVMCRFLTLATSPLKIAGLVHSQSKHVIGEKRGSLWEKDM